MPVFFILLFKINFVLVLFALTYFLILRKLTFYTINRYFLLFGILFSTAYPFINLTSFFKHSSIVPKIIPQLNQNVSEYVEHNNMSYFWSVLEIIFYFGVILMLGKLSIQLYSLFRVHKKSEPAVIDNLKVRILKDKVSPFSFWQTIYVNPVIHKKVDLDHILEHEKVHVDDLHTIDIILAELCVVFYWFNPGVWLMKKAVKENIEFITDAKILKKGIDKKAYQYSLLDVGSLHASVKLVNNFNLSDLKKRISMMNSKRSSRISMIRYLFILPVLLCLTLSFTIKKETIKKTFIPLKEIVYEVFPSDVKIENIKNNIALVKAPIIKKPVSKPTLTDTAQVNQELKAYKLVDTVRNGFSYRINFKKTSKDTGTIAQNRQLFIKSESLNPETAGKIKNILLTTSYTYNDLNHIERIDIINGKGKIKSDTTIVFKHVFFVDRMNQNGLDKIDVNDIIAIRMMDKDGKIEISMKK